MASWGISQLAMLDQRRITFLWVAQKPGIQNRLRWFFPSPYQTKAPLIGWMTFWRKIPGEARGPLGALGRVTRVIEEPVVGQVVAFWTKKAHLTGKTQSGRCRYIYILFFFCLVFWVGLKCKESLENIIRDTCLSNICDARNHCSCGFWDVLGIPS